MAAGPSWTQTGRTAETPVASTVHHPFGSPSGPGLFHVKGLQLPAYIQNFAHAFVRQGLSESEAIERAVGVVEDLAAGRTPNGKGHVHPDVQAAAAKAVAEWEAAKAAAHGSGGHGRSTSVVAQYRATISTADQNDLPDDAFALVQGGGTKDGSGKTVPRSLRHFPIHDACIIGSVEIPLLDGRQIPIQDLVGVDEFWVYSFDPETRAIVPGRGHSARMTMEAQTVARVILDSGEVVTTTPDHRFMLRSGDYRMAQDLAPGDSLMPLYRKVVQVHDKPYEKLWQPFYRYWELTHHTVDRYAHGPLLDGNVVHHHNEDQFNNTPGNLEQVTKGAHLAHHGDLNGETHLARLAEGSRRRWERPGERENAAARRRAFNLQMLAEGRLPTKPMRDWCATRESATAVHERYLSGESLRSLAAELGVSESGLKLGFRRYDLPSRRQAALLNNHKVVGVEFIDEPQPVYDLTVDHFHNFAIDVGVFVHNSHVRNALARLPQSNLSSAEKAQARGKIMSAAKKFGIDAEDSSDGGRSIPGFNDVEYREVRITSQYKDLDSRLEIRMAGDGGQWIGGYASVFMPRESRNLGGFIERVAPSAFSEAKARGWPDVVCRYNHDSNYVLGTAAAGTLQLRTDGVGLDYQVKPPESEARVRELVNRGDIRYSSFAFRCAPGGDEWGVTDQNFPQRTLHNVELIDVAPVLTPAYPDASAAVRATSPALRSLADHMQIAVDEVRSLADADELRRLFVRTDRPIYRPEPKKLFGPAAAAMLLARKTDPYE